LENAENIKTTFMLNIPVSQLMFFSARERLKISNAIFCRLIGSDRSSLRLPLYPLLPVIEHRRETHKEKIKMSKIKIR